MNIPNGITLFRIALVPGLVVVLLVFPDADPLIGFGIFLLAAVSDMADGVLARRMGQVTVLGQLLDPIADKVLISAVLICFVEMGVVPAWMVIVVISREFIISCFRIIASSRGVTIPSSNLGKFKMWCEVITISLLLLGESALGSWYILPRIGLWIMLAVVIISAVDYIGRARHLLREPD